jgi:phosphoribosylformylglycinamidine cyclo-ligase
MLYKDAGVNVALADKLVNLIGSDNSYAAKVTLPGGDTVALATDGVGTKLLTAKHFKKYDTIGIDLVAMCVNDLLCVGARPVSFLDYYATGKLDLDIAMDIINGIKLGCDMAKCDLVGGETAEMPHCYEDGKFDLAGFAMGLVEKELPKNVKPGNLIMGIPSSGPHANGYSLLRSLFPMDDIPLTPTKIYVDDIMNNLSDINACAHITGGGIHGNLPRVLNGHGYNIDVPLTSDWWKEVRYRTEMNDYEFQSTFNCGWGMLVIADKELPILGIKVLGKVV